MAYPMLSGWLAERRGRTKRADVRFSQIEKFISSGKRMVRGVASSISVDRMGDIVVPKGGSWTLPLPLLWQHQHDAPIGLVKTLEIRGDQIWMEAEIAEGIAKADEVWMLVEKALVDSFSIGFRGLATEPLPGGGVKFTKWELYEISCVTIPANPDAKISRANGVKLISASKTGAVKLARKYQAGVPLKKLHPGVKLKRADGAIDLRRDR